MIQSVWPIFNTSSLMKHSIIYSAPEKNKSDAVNGEKLSQLFRLIRNKKPNGEFSVSGIFKNRVGRFNSEISLLL